MRDFESAVPQAHPSRKRADSRSRPSRERQRAASHRLGALTGGIFLLLACVTPLRAEHAVIDLHVTSPDGETSAGSDQEPPAGGVNPRPLMKVRAGDPLVLQFILTNVYPHGHLKDVKVRYFIVRVDKIRQVDLPSLDDGAVVRGEVVMNFKPKCKVGARVRFRVAEPGVYLVRVDTQNTRSDHEHFSAIDLEVE